MKNHLILITFALLTTISYSQINSSFNKGFYDGFKETLNDSNITGNYNYLADPNSCNSQNTYLNDPKAEDKIYSDGYRCGVKQANKAISKINNNDEIKAKGSRLNFTNNIEENNRIAKQAIDETADLPDSQRAARIGQINSELQNANNRVIVEKSKNESRNKELNQKIENERKDIEYQNKSRIAEDNLNRLNQLRNEQIKSYNNYNQTITSTLNDLSNSMQQAAYANIQNELERRRQTANQFYERNTNRIDNITRIYNSIPLKNFNKDLSGVFNGNILVVKNYSFANGQKILSEIPVLVEIEQNQVKNIYSYGKIGFSSDFPRKYPEQSYLKNGIVEYNDYKTLEKTTLVLTEPYLSNNTGNKKVKESETGYLVPWTSKKKDDGKKIYIQELNVDGEIVREIETKLTYVKNKKELEKNNIKKIPINAGNDILYFGRPTNTSFGKFPLYLKVSKSDQKPLKNGEVREVKIKKYRE